MAVLYRQAKQDHTPHRHSPQPSALLELLHDGQSKELLKVSRGAAHSPRPHCLPESEHILVTKLYSQGEKNIEGKCSREVYYAPLLKVTSSHL